MPATGRQLFSRKYLSPDTQTIIGVSADERGQIVDRDSVVAAERDAYRAQHGVLSEGLSAHLDRLPEDSAEGIPVVAWLDESTLSLPAMPERRVWESAAELDAWVAESNRILAVRQSLMEAAARDVLVGVEDVQVHGALPIATGVAKASRLRALKTDGRLASLSAIPEKIAHQTDLADAAAFMRVTGSNSLNGSGFKGGGVPAGVWHPGYPNFVSQLGTPTYRMSNATTNGDQHLAYMIASIRNNRSVPSRGTGFAPSASVVVANFNDSSGQTFLNNAIDAYNWARYTRGVPILNQSWHLAESGMLNGYPANEEESGDQDFLDRMLDYGAMNYPYLLPIQAAGNISVDGEYVNHKGWNNLVVGQDLQSTSMASTSVSRNGNDGHELPHVTAGVDYSMSMFDNPDGTPVVTANGATSVAAAVMTGFAASVISVDPYLAQYPEVLRAVLMASAKNVVGGELNQDWGVDQQDGAGRPDGAYARDIAQHRTSNTSGLGAAGYQIASFGSSGQSRTLSFTTPGGHVKVAISWFAKISGANYVDTSLSDLDVRLFDSSGNLLSYSIQSNQPAELVTADVPAGTYTIRVEGYSVPYSTIYGVAWVTQ